MKLFSIDIIAFPLIFIPIVLTLMMILTLQLYNRTKQKNELFFGMVLLLSIFLSFLPYRWADGESLLFWSKPFHWATLSVLLTVGGSVFLLKGMIVRQKIAYAVFLLLVLITIGLPFSLSGMIVAFALISLGVFLLIEIRNGYFTETLFSILFLMLGLFIFIGHWFPFNGGRFLYGVILLTLLTNELVRFFERVIIMLQSASINSMTDPLTGLYNKGFLYRKAAQLVKQQDVGIIFADIDNFKLLNDTKGHDVGDVVLQQVGSLLEEILGEAGYACRFGGEELIGIVQNGNTGELAERFCRQVAKKTQVTVSVGTSFGKEDSKALIKLADERMYTAKTSGKNKVVS